MKSCMNEKAMFLTIDIIYSDGQPGKNNQMVFGYFDIILSDTNKVA